MQSINLSLNSIEKVKTFVNILATYNGDFDLVSERYIVDAKSIMGIFSLDLLKPLKLEIHDDSEAADVMNRLKDFII